MQYKKKLTDIFLRKEEKSKKQPIVEKPKILQFDESYFQAQLICDNIHTTLMKINAVIKKGPNAGQQVPLKCKWYTKNQFDFKAIQDVKGNCFQPCLEDVGNIICVQTQPYMEGMTYTGITIMKQSDLLKLDKKLENLSNDYFVSKHLQMEGKIEVIYSQNPIYENYEFPLEVVIQLRGKKVSFREKTNKQLVTEYEVTEDFPQIDFIRKSFNSILFTCNQNESMKLSLANNFNRDLFALILRSIPSRLSPTLLPHSTTSQQQPLPPHIDLNSSPIRQKSLIQPSSSSQQTTKLILRVDQLNKQLKNLRRINQEMTTNYHLERNAKINLQNQIQKLKLLLEKINEEHKECKPLHTKIKQIGEENRFYFGEISLMKNQVKEKNGVIKELKAQILAMRTEKANLQANIQNLTSVPATKIHQLQQQLSTSKSLIDQLQQQNESLKQKANELQNEKNLLKKKVSSIVSQKSLPTSPVKLSASKIHSVNSFQDLPISKDPEKQIKELKMQIANLEMLLKHKSGEKGGEIISMHLLVNSLTEKIAEKELEIQTLKKINKQLNKNVSGFSLKEVVD